MNTWSGLMLLRIEKYGGCCKHGNEHSGFVKHRKFLDQQEFLASSRRVLLHGVSVLWYDAVLFGWPFIIWRQQVAHKRLVFVLCITFRLLRSHPSALHCTLFDARQAA